MSYFAGDDVTQTYPVTDSNGGPLDFTATVTARRWLGDPQTIDGAWTGSVRTLPDDAGTQRDLTVPLATLPAGLWGLYLVVAGDGDVFLGNVVIQ